LTVEAVQEQVRQLRQEYTTIRREFRSEPELKIRLDGQEVRLQELAAREVRDHIWNWPVWNTLLHLIDQGRFRPTRRRRTDKIPRDSLAFLGDQVASPTPRFRQTLEASWESVERNVRDAIPNLLTSLRGRIRYRIEPLVRLLEDRRVDQRVGRLMGRTGGHRPQDLLTSLRDATNPAAESIIEEVLKEVFTKEAPWKAERYYPLAGTKGDEFPQDLLWSTSDVVEEPELCNDQFLMIRLRNHLVKAARHPVLQRVQELNEKVFASLELIFLLADQDNALPDADDYLGALNESYPLLNNLSQLRGLHPFLAFFELSRLLGRMALFGPGRRVPRDLPLYDHENLGDCFNRIQRFLDHLLTRFEPRYKRRLLKVAGQRLKVPLDGPWLLKGWDLYLAVKSELSPDECRALLGREQLDMKVASSDRIDELYDTSQPGIEIHESTQPPRDLPVSLERSTMPSTAAFRNGAMFSRPASLRCG